MDTAISNGDFLLDSRNRPISISGIRELFQRVLIKLTVKKGSFIYDKNLGSRLYTLNSKVNDIKSKAFSIISEALNDMPEVFVKSILPEFIDDGGKLRLEILLSIKGEEEDVVIII